MAQITQLEIRECLIGVIGRGNRTANKEGSEYVTIVSTGDGRRP